MRSICARRARFHHLSCKCIVGISFPRILKRSHGNVFAPIFRIMLLHAASSLRCGKRSRHQASCTHLKSDLEVANFAAHVLKGISLTFCPVDGGSGALIAGARFKHLRRLLHASKLNVQEHLASVLWLLFSMMPRHPLLEGCAFRNSWSAAIHAVGLHLIVICSLTALQQIPYIFPLSSGHNPIIHSFRVGNIQHRLRAERGKRICFAVLMCKACS